MIGTFDGTGPDRAGAGASHFTYPGVLEHGSPLCQAGSWLGKVGESSRVSTIFAPESS